MRVFAQVVEAKSFSAAADKLGMSKSLASRHVSALEHSLSVKLLNRSTRKLSLTEAGALFYEHCARIVQEAELAEQRLTRSQAYRPAWSSDGGTRVCGAHVCPRSAISTRDIRRSGQALVQQPLTRPRRCRVRPGHPDILRSARISWRESSPRIRSVLCASAAYVERHGVPQRVEDLSKHECVLFAADSRGVWTLRRDGRKYSVPVAGAFETDEMEAVRAAIVAGLGLGTLPLYMAADALRQGRLVPLLRKFQVVPESAIYLVYLPNRTLASRVRALIDFLAERFGSTPSWEAGF
jgi:DNA-binding transcriptional LysR family regulator